MVHGGVKEKLNGRRKLFVPFPKDILKRHAGESIKDERGIPNLNRFPPGSDARLFKRLGGFPKPPLQGFGDPSCKNTCIEEASRNILVGYPFSRQRIPIRTDEIMEEKNAGNQRNHLFRWGMKFHLRKLDMIGL
jgi:hypothetical protein